MNHSSPIFRWQKKLEHEICRLEKKMCLRELRPHSGRIDFSSNDYLSLNANGLIKKLLQEQLENWEKEFVGSTGSRLLSGHYEAFTRLEEHFSQKIGVRSSLFFSSGYAANTGTLSAILGPRDTAFCDRLCHASLLDGLRLSQPHRCYFRHNDLEDLENKLKYYSSKRGRRSSYWIIAEAVYSMDGDSHDLVALCDLAERYEACIYLDEAHSVGVRGGGAGLAQETGVLERIAVSVFPCGKAIGLMGAFVCGPEALKTILINKARSFVYSTAPLPLLAPLLFSVLDLVFSKKMDAARAHLRLLSSYFRSEIEKSAFITAPSVSQIVPIITGSIQEALSLADRCGRAGFDVRAVRPPSVPIGESRLRFVLQAGLSKKDIENLCAVLF